MMIVLFAILSMILQIAPASYNNPGQYGKHFEGDIILIPRQKDLIKQAIKTRNGLVELATRWPNRTVVYEIKEDDFGDEEIEVIKIAMAVLALRSCLKFRPREGSEYAVVIQGTGKGCYSNVGYVKGMDKTMKEQVLNLDEGCVTHGTVSHEMLHTLGFFHMQSTYNRNDYIKVIWRNIKPGEEHNFDRYNRDTVTNFGVPYDYESIMHYDDRAFSKNGKKTIVALEDNVRIRQSRSLRLSDLHKLNRMYCLKRKNGKEEEDSSESEEKIKSFFCIWPFKHLYPKYCNKSDDTDSD